MMKNTNPAAAVAWLAPSKHSSTPCEGEGKKRELSAGLPLLEGPRVDPRGGRQGTVGITDHAQKQLGDVVFLELPEVGRDAHGGRGLRHRGVGEGRVRALLARGGRGGEGQRRLTKTPEKVNTDPHGEAWMIVVEPGRSEELAGLMDAAAYEAYVASEAK